MIDYKPRSIANTTEFSLSCSQKDSSIDTMLESFDFRGFRAFEWTYLT
jgi:hypothetical protein